MSTTTNPPETAYVRPRLADPHPLCQFLRELRRAAGLSLADVENQRGISGVALASYERGDRTPSILRMDEILNFYGYRLAAVPIQDSAQIRTALEAATTLRAIADQIQAADAARTAEKGIWGTTD